MAKLSIIFLCVSKHTLGGRFLKQLASLKAGGLSRLSLDVGGSSATKQNSSSRQN